MMRDESVRWVARLTPTPGSSIDTLLGMPLGLDVWEVRRDHPDPSLMVAASDEQLAEIERRSLARVERLVTVAEYAAGAKSPDTP